MMTTFVAQFFAGAFLCNCLPHLASGLQGRPFPSPFARPPGKGDSSPLINVLWGMFNLVAGGALLLHWPLVVGFNGGTAAALLGALALGCYVALHFGAVMASRQGGTGKT